MHEQEHIDKCPNCGLIIPTGTFNCDCGYKLTNSNESKVNLSTILPIPDRPLTPDELRHTKWKTVRKYRWVDEQGVIRKYRNWLSGIFWIWTALVIIGGGGLYAQSHYGSYGSFADVIVSLILIGCFIHSIREAMSSLSLKDRSNIVQKNEIQKSEIIYRKK